MNDQPDFIFPTAEIGAGRVWVEPATVVYPMVLHKDGRHLIRVHPDMSVELVEGATIREVLTVLVQVAGMGNAPDGVPEVLADEIIRLAREDRS